MWLFTRYGFFSIAVYQQGRVQVRARLRAHLAALCNHFGWTDTIGRTEPADYRWRIDIEQARWVEAVAQLAREQTWANFKDETALWQKGRRYGAAYHRAMLRVWREMAELQSREETGDVLRTRFGKR